MHHSTLRRAIVRLGRYARLCLPALALALALGTVVCPPPPKTDTNISNVEPPIRTPLVNWNS